jgi:hypothetical protein
MPSALSESVIPQYPCAISICSGLISWVVRRRFRCFDKLVEHSRLRILPRSDAYLAKFSPTFRVGLPTPNESVARPTLRSSKRAAIREQIQVLASRREGCPGLALHGANAALHAAIRAAAKSKQRQHEQQEFRKRSRFSAEGTTRRKRHGQDRRIGFGCTGCIFHSKQR